jgi:uncharacterized repeat protein (TIGR03803 family)
MKGSIASLASSHRGEAGAAVCRAVGAVVRVGVLILLAGLSPVVQGQTLTTLASFNGSSLNGGNGQNPYASLTLSGNTLYGTTARGGADTYGTVFSLPLSGGSPTVLTSFDGSIGAFLMPV